ncbi:DUF4271 domain-containing protein [Parabacteroides pacaensis]|uniref:DUF4271 domain-containing protein n=1 Tax=Parabacteroides pacaensis TaxID=2086575 RepID=UPI001F2135BD|nr:DUF4271 domain-containing protein [Parabacteroides pacaensis]
MNVILSIQQVLHVSSDGYTGIRLADEQLVNDVVFAWIIGMFLLFSIVYRNNFRLFLKMLQDFRTVKERQSLFLLASNREGFFRNFMTFQTLMLITLALFSIARIQGSIPPAMSERMMFFALLILFGILLFYYFFKQGMYFCIGYVFTTPQKYKLWKSRYNAVIGVWGILLYFPVLWISYVDGYHTLAIWLFIILFILSRLVIIYKLIRIFYKKSDNLLYLILYLCAQEILPLVFLYEGLVYLYNFIETSTLWH